MKNKMTQLPEGKVLVGDALTKLRTLPSGSVDTVVTSPPYFRLRDYGHDHQIGLETNIDDWVNQLTQVCKEIGRVLKPAGSLWLNLGDTYSRQHSQGSQPKSLLLGPERLLLQLAADGWVVRNKVVWAKPNPMPSSVSDRLSNTWEPIYLLTRSQHYFFDLDAIRVPPKSPPKKNSQLGGEIRPSKYVTNEAMPAWSGPQGGNNSGLAAMKAEGRNSHPLGKNPGDVWTIPTATYKGAHFATYPSRLVEPPLLATCPQKVCSTCGWAWRRARTAPALGKTAVLGALRKSCGCSHRDHQPGIVLDPFLGAGTTAIAANALNRRWVGIELNPDYAELAKQRITAATTTDDTTNELKGGGNAT